MKFERLESGDFVIDGVLVRRQVFFMLEPHYSEPMNTIHMKYEQGVGRIITTTEKQYRIDGVWEEGDRYFRRLYDFKKASGIVETQINQELAETNALMKSVEEKSYRDSRRDEYPPLTDLVVALWENLVEKKSKKDSGVEAIQKLRKAIKSKYPTENADALSEDETETD
jgi:hypothetical protein